MPKVQVNDINIFIYDVDEIKAMAELIPHAKYHCFHNVGHLPHLEQPEEFCELVLNFLRAQR